jgi:hypothetical protein
MGWAGYEAHTKEQRGAYRELMQKPGERDNLEDSCFDGRIKIRWIFKKWKGDMDWIILSQDTDKWLVFVKAVMKFRVP